MKKLIKKILTIACCFTMCIICLTGCSWLQLVNSSYYNQLVVTVGDKDFNKKDLIEAFSNYGYQYYEQYGYTLENSVNQTITSMIDRWLLLEEVKSNDKFKIDEDGPEALQIKKQVFDYMQDSIFTYEEQVRKEWDMVVEVEDNHDHTEPLRTAETEYTPTTYYDPYANNENGFVVFRTQTDNDETVDVGNLKITDHFNKSFQIITNKKVSDEAWTRYVKALQDSAKNEGRSEKESDVLLHEEMRLTELLTNNLYLDKYEKDFYENYPVDVQTVLEYYRNQYKSQREQFLADESLYHTAMQKASSEYVYFHRNSGNEYANVKHILINFSEAQKAEIENLKTRYGITDDGSEADEAKKIEVGYYEKLNTIALGKTKSTFELDGNTYTWAAIVSNNGSDTVYDYVNNHVTAATLEERAKQFNELIYVFNDDPGMMNSEFDYVVNLDTNVKDQMVKPFADEVRNLDKQYKESEGKDVGLISYTITTYGVHILFHAGSVENIVGENDIDNISDEDLLRILCTNYTTPDSNKSIFNYIYDKLSLDTNAYNTKSSQAVKTARTRLKAEGIEIVYYPKNYEDLWK